MSRAFNKAVITLFTQGMKNFPEWLPEKPPREHAWPGERAYCRKGLGRIAWLCLVPSPKGYNEFTLECGWSKLGRYPQLGYRPNVITFSVTELDKLEEGFFRLGEGSRALHGWWGIAPNKEPSLEIAHLMCKSLDAEEARVLAGPLVEDALNVVRTSAQRIICQILGIKENVPPIPPVI